MTDDIVTKDGSIYGTWHVAKNYAIGMADTIHSDELAQKMGQRGGMIVGWTYLDLFPPLFLKTFGQQWFERGSLSIFFTYALMDGEEVRTVMGVPPEGAKDAQVKVWAETPEGKTVCTGTASIGEPKELSYLLAMDLQNAKPEDRRILHDLNVGDPMPGADVLITPETAAGRVKIILDPMDWYTGDSPWGGPILCPSSYYNALSAGDPNQRMGVEEHRAASFMGAEELRNVNGPIKAGVPYRSGGKFICVGSSPKTEFFWYDSWLDERDTGKRVAEMRQMWRYFKADSPLWKED